MFTMFTTSMISMGVRVSPDAAQRGVADEQPGGQGEGQRHDAQIGRAVADHFGGRLERAHGRQAQAQAERQGHSPNSVPSRYPWCVMTLARSGSPAPMCRATRAVTPVAVAAKKVVTSITA